MKKLMKVLLILLVILGAIAFLLKGIIQDKGDITTMIGSKIGTRELSLREYYSVAQCFETYQNYLSKGDYKTAYSMLHYQYRHYVSLEEYQAIYAQKDVASLKVMDIVPITATTYQLTVNDGGKTNIYTLLLNLENETFSFFPDSFLLHKDCGIKKSQKQLEVVCQDYIVYTDVCAVQLRLTNSSSQEIQIEKSTLHTTLGGKIEGDKKITIPAHQTVNVTLSFATQYEFPQELVLERSSNDKKAITYHFAIQP